MFIHEFNSLELMSTKSRTGFTRCRLCWYMWGLMRYRPCRYTWRSVEKNKLYISCAKSFAGCFSCPPITSRTEVRHIDTACLPSTIPNSGLRTRFNSVEPNFCRIARTLAAETLVSGKSECLLAVGEDKNISFLESED